MFLTEPASLMQHDMLTDVRVGSLADKRSRAKIPPLSALVQKQTNFRDAAIVRFVPKADSCTAANSTATRSRSQRLR
jgi:hypothetical protein